MIAANGRGMIAVSAERNRPGGFRLFHSSIFPGVLPQLLRKATMGLMREALRAGI
jgi:hypothetical protein